MTWKKSDMKQCHKFLQDTELVLHKEFLWRKSLDTTCFKTTWGSDCFHTSDGSVHSLDPRFNRLLDAPMMSFSKEHNNCHVIYYKSGSHPDKLVCGWDPLDPPKSDPDSLGHPTHFQPWKLASWLTFMGLCIQVISQYYTLLLIQISLCHSPLFYVIKQYWKPQCLYACACIIHTCM